MYNITLKDCTSRCDWKVMPKNADRFDWTWIQFQLLKRPVKNSLVKKNKITKPSKMITFACFKQKHNRIFSICEGTAKRIGVGGVEMFGNLCFSWTKIKSCFVLCFDFSKVPIKPFCISLSMANPAAQLRKALTSPHVLAKKNSRHTEPKRWILLTNECFYVFPAASQKTRVWNSLAISKYRPSYHLSALWFYFPSFLPKGMDFIMEKCVDLGSSFFTFTFCQRNSCFHRRGNALLEES